MKFDHLRQTAPQLMKIAKRYGISKIYVFGSVARGESTAQSDVDLLVEMETGASLFGVAGFNFEIMHEAIDHMMIDNKYATANDSFHLTTKDRVYLLVFKQPFVYTHAIFPEHVMNPIKITRV